MSILQRWDPEFYVKNSSIQLGHAKSLLDRYSFCGNERVLDIGCGDGKITAGISTLIPDGEITGLDHTTSMLNFARVNFPPSKYPNMNFIQQDAAIVVEENAFDLIVSFSCLHYIKEQLAVLRAIKRALKPTGQILLMLYRKCPDQWNAIKEVAALPRWKNTFADFDPGYHEFHPENYNRLLVQAGLSRFSAIFTEVEYLKYENAAHLMHFMQGWLPHMKLLTEREGDDFIVSVVERYLRNLRVKLDGEILVPFVRLIVSLPKNKIP